MVTFREKIEARISELRRKAVGVSLAEWLTYMWQIGELRQVLKWMDEASRTPAATRIYCESTVFRTPPPARWDADGD
jgi:hypothetical protein